MSSLACLVAASLLLCSPVAAQTLQAPAQLYNEGDLKLESGEAIKDFSISYVTFGALNARKSNAILMVTALGGNHHRLDFMIGPGKALDPEKPAVEITDADRAEALVLLQDPKLLDRILADFERCGIVGEETNKLVAYLAVVSRHLDAPLAVVVQSSSAAGKSSLMDAVLAFVPEEERVQYSAMTGQSLYYMGEMDLKHKVLAIVEEEGAARAGAIPETEAHVHSAFLPRARSLDGGQAAIGASRSGRGDRL